ncbi:hypothetical protein E2320_022119, partial [Naja naja]
MDAHPEDLKCHFNPLKSPEHHFPCNILCQLDLGEGFFQWPMIWLLVLLWTLPAAVQMDLRPNCFWRRPFLVQKDYYRPGDFIIANLAIISDKTFLPLCEALPSRKDELKDGRKEEKWLDVGSEPSQGDRTDYPSFFQINPKEFPQYVGLVQLLLYFQWNWVGLVVSKGDSGERFLSSLMPMLKEKEICLAFTIIFNSYMLRFSLPIKTLSKAEVIVLFGDFKSVSVLLLYFYNYAPFRKTSVWKIWIITSHWTFRGKVRRMAGLPLLLLLLFWLLPPAHAERMPNRAVLPNNFQVQQEYYKPGDLIIGGNFLLTSIHYFKNPNFSKDPSKISPTLVIGFDFSQGDRMVYPSFFPINPNEFHQYVALVQLLLYFQWNWIGLIPSESDSGKHFISTLMPMLKEKEICLAFPDIFNFDILVIKVAGPLIFKIFQEVEVITLFGDSSIISMVLLFLLGYSQSISFWKVWLLPSFCDFSVVGSKEILQFRKYFHGALHLRERTRDLSEFIHFLLSLDPLNPE